MFNIQYTIRHTPQSEADLDFKGQDQKSISGLIKCHNMIEIHSVSQSGFPPCMDLVCTFFDNINPPSYFRPKIWPSITIVSQFMSVCHNSSTMLFNLSDHISVRPKICQSVTIPSQYCSQKKQKN